jgi:hypothetical protein
MLYTMPGHGILTATVVQICSPAKAEEPFTPERMEEHNRQRRALQKTGHAKIKDIHGTTIYFTVEDTGEENRKVLRVEDDLGHSATEEIGPHDAILALYNARFMMCQRYPTYGDNYSGIRQIQRYCPFELGVWKDVPMGAGKKVFHNAEKTSSTKTERNSNLPHPQAQSKNSNSLPQETQSPPPYVGLTGACEKWHNEKVQQISEIEKADSLKCRRATFLGKTCKFVKNLFTRS